MCENTVDGGAQVAVKECDKSRFTGTVSSDDRNCPTRLYGDVYWTAVFGRNLNFLINFQEIECSLLRSSVFFGANIMALQIMVTKVRLKLTEGSSREIQTLQVAIHSEVRI